MSEVGQCANRRPPRPTWRPLSGRWFSVDGSRRAPGTENPHVSVGDSGGGILGIGSGPSPVPCLMAFRANTLQPFDELASTWWDESGTLHGLGVLLNRVRVPFVMGALGTELGPGPHRLLDLGAGGGLLADAVAGAGHTAIALDPSLPSVRAGRDHAASAETGVSSLAGRGEQLPFSDGCFDAVLCMEVLEHVDDPEAVIAEAARVLRPEGLFVFSGPNRTITNRIGLVMLAQDLLGVIPRGTHEWRRLIRPAEMNRYLRNSAIDPIRTLGVGLRVRSLPRAALAFVGLVTGRATHPDAARRMKLVAGTGTAIAYQGFGRRR